jgi:hypothetical protein
MNKQKASYLSFFIKVYLKRPLVTHQGNTLKALLNKVEKQLYYNSTATTGGNNYD